MARLMARSDMRTGGVQPPESGERGYGGGDGPGDRGSSRRASLLGVALMLAAIGMFFSAFGAAYLLRRGMSRDWVPLTLPGLVWLSTGLIAAGSIVLEYARVALRGGRRAAFNHWWTAGTVCGLGFLASQWAVWARMQEAGPAAMFFYVVTAAHAAHMAGGLAALLYVEFQALRYRLGPGRRTHATVAAIYWHGMGVIWAGILILFRF